MTAKEWRENKPELAKKGNMRDYTDLLHLVILSNLETINACLISDNVSRTERLIKLNNNAKMQEHLIFQVFLYVTSLGF